MSHGNTRNKMWQDDAVRQLLAGKCLRFTGVVVEQLTDGFIVSTRLKLLAGCMVVDACLWQIRTTWGHEAH